MRNILTLVLIVFATLFLNACRDMSPVDPQNVENEKVKGIYINPDFLRPRGIDTLFVNEMDTVEVAVRTILINDPVYEWKSTDESVIKILNDPNHDSLAYVVAVADSGFQASLILTDQGNITSKTIPVVIVKYWADPMFYAHLGTLNKHYYYMSRFKKTWIEAKADCEDHGGHLLTITSQEENSLISTNPIRNNLEVWIGMTFLFGNDKLTKWITGESVTIENYNSKPSDPGIFAEYYFYMDPSGEWENWHEISYNYILEME